MFDGKSVLPWRGVIRVRKAIYDTTFNLNELNVHQRISKCSVVQFNLPRGGAG